MEFKDNNGRMWSMKLDAPTIQKVRDRHSIDLLGVSEADNPWHKLRTDLVLLCMVAWTICEKQASSLSPSVTPDDFGESLTGQAIDDAGTALWESVNDFIPPKMRQLPLTLREQQERMETSIREIAMRKATDKNLEAEFLKQAEAGIDAQIKQLKDKMQSFYDATSTPE